MSAAEVVATTAVLLHGLCSTPDELMPVAAALRHAGHRVRPLLVPGYSFDPALVRQRATPYRQWLQVVIDEVSAQRALGQRVVLVGISAGAALALGAAMHCSGALQGLVLMSTTLRYDGWAVPRHQFLMPLALYTPLGRFWSYRERPPYGVKNPRVRQWIERELTTRRISCAGSAVIGVPHLRQHDLLRRRVMRELPRLRCPPVLVLHAREDEVAGPGNVALLERKLKTPSFRAIMLADSYHMISIDNDRLQVARETVHFIDSVAAHPPTAAGPAARGAEPHVHVHV